MQILDCTLRDGGYYNNWKFTKTQEQKYLKSISSSGIQVLELGFRFLKKNQDYGMSWTIMRLSSLTDQIFIKALRIRTIQEKKTQLVGDDISSEFKGIINYAIIGMIQLQIGDARVDELSVDEVNTWYDKYVAFAKETMENKNHDYGEAWRDMSQESFADLIIMKLQRIKQILANDGKTIMSEGIDANYVDILNYSVFALILM